MNRDRIVEIAAIALALALASLVMLNEKDIDDVCGSNTRCHVEMEAPQ